MQTGAGPLCRAVSVSTLLTAAAAFAGPPVADVVAQDGWTRGEIIVHLHTPQPAQNPAIAQVARLLGPVRVDDQIRAGEIALDQFLADVLDPIIAAYPAGQRPALTAATPLSRSLLIRVPLGQEQDWIQTLQAHPEVAAAERNGIGQGGIVPVPDDPVWPELWHLENTGQMGGTPGADIEVRAAWQIEDGSPDVVVAVLDTGLNLNHPDFVGRVAPGGYDFVAEDNNPTADHPHGTWVAGLIAAEADNSFGTSGVDRAAKILPIKVLNQNNSGTTFDLIQGLDYTAARPEVDVVNLSLINYPAAASLQTALTNLRAAGKIVVACAGNSGAGDADLSWPGASPETISIGWTDAADVRADLSATGAALDLVAPGNEVATADAAGNNSADIVSGCSFATPLTAGVATLMVALAESLAGPIDHDIARTYLIAGAEDQVGPAPFGVSGGDAPGRDNDYGHGRINAKRSLEALATDYDCNDTGLWDGSEIAAAPIIDIDSNGVIDSCEICAVADIAAPFGELNLADVQDFLEGFGTLSAVADINGDGTLNLSDVQDFLITFSNGCN